MEIQKAKELRDKLQEELRDKLQEDILSLIKKFEEDNETHVYYVNVDSEGFCSISWAEFKYCEGN